MDISATLAPKSDQLDAVDLLSGPQTFTVTSVTAGNAEQPVQVRLAEFPRVWRPGKSMRRVLAHCWGADASKWTGRRVTLYCDPDVQFGGEAVGGTRISHLSHIDGAKKVPLLIKKGRSATFTVQPLADAPTAPTLTAAEISACTSLDQLREWWTAHPNMRDAITARKEQLTAAPEQDALPMGGEQA